MKKYINGKKMNCSEGIGRTETILSVYIIKNRDMTADKAINKISTVRGEAIQSKGQERILFTYEKYLKTKQEKKEKQ